MSVNKKYFYLKLKEDFYDSEQMIILQSMTDGYLYSDILMKLYLRSLKFDGRLMFNEKIPYTPNILAQVVRHKVGVVKEALRIFVDLGFIKILDNGAIYMMDIQNFVGKSTTEADRIRKYRNRIKSEEETSLLTDNTGIVQTAYKCTPEIELELEIEKDIDNDDDDDVKKIKKHLKDNLKAQDLNDKAIDNITRYLIKGVPADIIIEVIDRAAANNKAVHKVNYICKCLDNWLKDREKLIQMGIESPNDLDSLYDN